MPKPHRIPKPRFVLSGIYVRLEYRFQPNMKTPLRINTGFTATKKEWDKKAMRFIDTTANLTKNGTLSQIETACKEIYSELGPRTTKDRFKEAILRRLKWIEDEAEHKPTLIEFAELYIQKKKDDPEIGTQHPKHLQKSLNNIIQFGKWRKKEVGYNENWTEYLEEVKYWAYKVKGWQRSTLNRHLKYLTEFLNASHAEGLHQNLGYKSRAFKIKRSGTSFKMVFYVEDLEKLAACKFEDPKHERIRDLFLIGCLTLMRISDFSKLKPHHIRTRGKMETIEVWTEKTNTRVSIPLTPLLKSLFQKYNFQIPKVSDQYFNRTIKEVCKIAGFTKMIEVRNTKGGTDNIEMIPQHQKISSHCCRRSGATNLYLSGVPTYAIRKLTGHSSDAMLMKYIVIGDRTTADQMANTYQNLKIV